MSRGPRLLLAMVVRLLPATRQDWGRAMNAELDGVVPQRERWSFAIGCATTVLRQFVILKSLAYTMITAAAIVTVVVWSADITYAPLRWRAVALVAALAAVITLGRTRSPLGPVAENKTAQLLRSAGLIVVAVVTIGFLTGLPARNNPVDEARYGVPIIGSVLVFYLIGFVAVTARRSIATGRALRWGAASGFTAALVWLAAVVASPHIPANIDLALLTLAIAVVVAIYANAKHPAQAWLAALLAGTVSTLLTGIELVGLATYAPARMIPPFAPAALTHTADIEQSRAELQDPYVLLFAIGALMALTLGTTSILARARRSAAAVQPAHPGSAAVK